MNADKSQRVRQQEIPLCDGALQLFPGVGLQDREQLASQTRTVGFRCNRGLAIRTAAHGFRIRDGREKRQASFDALNRIRFGIACQAGIERLDRRLHKSIGLPVESGF